MKGAAKCDNHCELQNSVNQLELERKLRFRDIPESMLTSVSSSFRFSTLRAQRKLGALLVMLVRQVSQALTHRSHGWVPLQANC